MKRWLRWLLLAGCLLPLRPWADEALVATLDADHVDVTVDFAGTELNAYGAVSRTGDLIIKVVGPPQTVVLTREVRYGPFWIGGDKVSVTGAPGLLYLYATRPVTSLLPPAEQEKYGLRLEGVPVHIEPQPAAGTAEDWRKAFFRIKEKEHYYLENTQAIRLIDNRLFLTRIPLPGNLELGNYTVEMLLVNSGKVIGRKVTRFEVRQVGIERWVWNAAHRHSWLFGVAFTLAAMLLGFSLNALYYRKR